MPKHQTPDLTGFMGSETSGIELFIYPNVEDPALLDSTRTGSSRPNEAIRLVAQSEGSKEIHARRDPSAKLVAFSFRKMLSGAGGFTATIKARDPGFVNQIQALDWVDVVAFRHERRYHVMRGFVTVIREGDRITGSGATSTEFTIEGEDHTRVFQRTPIWFDRVTDQDYAGAAFLRILDKNKSFFGDPAATVRSLLSGFLREENNRGRPLWRLPSSLPLGTTASGGETVQGAESPSRIAALNSYFADHTLWIDRDFVNYPTRNAIINSSLYDPQNTNVWSLANSYADPLLCDLYCDLVRADGSYLGDLDEVDVGDTKMAVIFRDKPFLTKTRKRGLTNKAQTAPPVSAEIPASDPAPGPVTTVRTFTDGEQVEIQSLESSSRRTKKMMRDAQILGDVAIGKEASGGTAASTEAEPLASGPYLDRSRTPQFVAYSTEIVAINVARNDNNRVNAIFAAPVFFGQGLGNLADYEIPLMQVESVPVHGMRRLDVRTNYVSLSNTGRPVRQDVLGLVETYRERLRDFYCLNHLYLNGTINFGLGRPDIRVGGRLTIADPGSVAYQQSAEGMFEFYVEGVAHTWSLQSGLRTTLSVSRGWKGNQEGHLRGLRNTIAKFGKILPSVPPGA